MEYPIYLDDESIEKLEEQARQAASPRARRLFVITRVGSSEKRDAAIRTTESYGLMLFHWMPVFYVVACMPQVHSELQVKVTKHILQTLRIQDIEFMGGVLGYTQSAINWYANEVANSVARTERWLTD